MPDVFVSYAREDREAVRRLDDALQARGLDTWVDWDILPSADWMSEVERAITGSNAFLFTLSPDSLRSPMCRRELDHATQLRKRIVPVVLREVDSELVPESVRSLNWVFCRTSDEFDSAVDALGTAFALDVDWVHDHTRLLVRSIDWETHERDGSRLLRGGDLVAAEQWLADAGHHDGSEPTALQIEYLVASRRASTRSSRRRIAALSVALIVALVLAGAAVVQRNEARKQTEIAQGRELVASSAATLASDPELSLWFAIRAAATASSPQADALLRQAFHESRVRAAYRDPGAPAHPEYRVLAVSPDLHRILVRDTKGTVYLRSLTNREQPVPFDVVVGSSLPDEASFSPDGSEIAIADGVYSAETGRRLFQLSGRDSTFTADGSRLFGFENQQVSVWDRAGVLVRAIPTTDFLVAANRDGTALLSWNTCNHCSSLPTVWDVASGQRRFVLGDPNALAASSVNPNDPQSLLGTAPTMVAAFSPDDKYIVTGDAAGVIRVWLAAAPLAAVAEFHGHTRAVTSLAFSDDGNRVLSGSSDRTARVFELASGETEYLLRGHTTAVRRAMFAHGDDRVATIHGDGTVRVWDSAPFRRDESTFEHQGIPNLQIDDAGRRVLDSDRLGHAGVWSLDTGTQLFNFSAAIRRVPRAVGQVTVEDVFMDAALSANGRRVVALDTDGNDAQVWDVASGTSVARLSGAASVRGVPSVDADGRRATTFGATGVRIWDARTGSLLRTLDTGPVERAFLDNDGQRVLVVSAGETSVWDAATGARIANLASPGTGVQHFRFSRDGELLTGVGEAGSVCVWDTATGALRRAGYIAAPEQSARPVVFAAFGSDAHQLFTIASNGDLRVWDTASGRQLAEPPAATISNQLGVDGAQVTPDGQRVVVVVGAFTWRYGCPLCLSTPDLLTRARSHVSSYVRRHARVLLESQ